MTHLPTGLFRTFLAVAVLVVAASPALAQTDSAFAAARAAGADDSRAASLASAVRTVTGQAKLLASDGSAFDFFGYAISLSGDRALVSAYGDDGGFSTGSAYVFDLAGGVWTETAKLTASDATVGDAFGVSVSLLGDRALVGAFQDDDAGSSSGSAYVFDLTTCSGACTESAKLTASDAATDDKFGVSVSLSGSRALIGAFLDNDAGTDSGSAYVFEFASGAWAETAKLTASDAAANDELGYSVSLSGDRALVGSRADDDGTTTDSGSAYAFDLSTCSAACTESAKLTASDAAAGDAFGISVSLLGTRALVGASGDDDVGSASGSAYVFDLAACGTACTESDKLTASDAASDDQFGLSVSLSGDRALIGAQGDDDAGASSGSAYVFDLSGGTWTETDKVIPDDGVAGDSFGFAVSLSGDRLLVGAWQDDDNGTFSGSAYAFEIAPPVMVTLDGGEGFRTLASPEATTIGEFLSVVWTQGFVGADDPNGDCMVFRYDEATDFVCVTGASEALLPGEGLLVYAFADDDPATSGVQGGFPKTLAPMSAVQPTPSFDFAVAYTDDSRPDVAKGWNLLGTPFGTSFDWVGMQRVGVDGTLYIFDPGGPSLGDFNGWIYTVTGSTGSGTLAGGIVPPFQGFLVQATAPAPTMMLQIGAAAPAQDVYGRRSGANDPPALPPVPAQSFATSSASDDIARLGTALGTVDPNPTTGAGTVGWTLAQAGPVRVTVLDLLGREVAVLADGVQSAGSHRAPLAVGLAPGVYVVRLQAGDVAEAGRFTVVR